MGRAEARSQPSRDYLIVNQIDGAKTMGLFDQFLGAIENPQLQANPNQLGNILQTVQHIASNHGADSPTTQTIMSLVSSHVRSALQQQQAQGQIPHAIVNQYSGTTPNSQAVDALFPPAQQNQIAQEIAQRTGANAGMVQAMLPAVVPIILNLIQGGTDTQSPRAGNPILTSFLDANSDGALDMGDVAGLMSRFIK